MPVIKQSSFAGGEISPLLYGRNDLVRYQHSLRTMLNWMVSPEGAARNRPGTLFVKEVKDSTNPARLIPFIVGTDTAYLLEVGSGYLRIFTAGGAVADPGGKHDGAANAAVLKDSKRDWVVNSLVGYTLTNVTDGSTTVVTANTIDTATGVLAGGTDDDWDVDDVYTFADANGDPVPLEVPTPFVTGKIGAIELKHSQSRDVMILTNQGFRPHILRRIANDDWQLRAQQTSTDVQPPTTLAKDSESNTAARHTLAWDYKVTSAVKAKESLPTAKFSDTTSKLDGTEGVWTRLSWVAPTTGPAPEYYNVYRGRDDQYGWIGWTKGVKFTDRGQGPDYGHSPPDQLDPFVDTDPDLVFINEVDILESGGPPVTNLTATKTDAVKSVGEKYVFHWFYIAQGGVQADAFIAEFDVDGVSGFTEISPRTFGFEPNPNLGFGDNAFLITAQVGSPHEFESELHCPGLTTNGIVRIVRQAGGTTALISGLEMSWEVLVRTGASQQAYPKASCFFDQRLFFASVTTDSHRVIGSKSADLFNFDRSIPVRDSDAIELSLASLRSDEIQWVVPLNALIVGTFGAVWAIRGAQGFPLTPTSFDAKIRAHVGCAPIQPVLAARRLLFVSQRNRELREFVYSEQGDPIEPRDLTILTRHLFKRYTVMDIDWAEVPHNAVWVVRSDGTLCGMTFLPEQELWGWHRHELGGTAVEVESIAVIPETLPIGSDVVSDAYADHTQLEHVLYVAVKRTINSVTKRYIERMSSRDVINRETTRLVGGVTTDVNAKRDWRFMDSAVSFDGRNKSATQYRLKDEVPDWTSSSTATLESDTGTPFVAADVGTHFELIGSDGEKIRVLVTVVAGPPTATCTVQLLGTAPATLQTTYTKLWGHAKNTFTLSPNHLEGETVTILVDGGAHQDKVVTAGVVTLDTGVFGVVVHVGLGYTQTLESLPAQDARNAASSSISKKLISSLALEVDDFTGLSVGQRLSKLTPVKDTHVVTAYEGQSPDHRIVIIDAVNRKHDYSVSIAIQQTKPLPCSILSAIADIEVTSPKTRGRR